MINGAVGDRLRTRRNALAIDMALIHANRPFAPTAAAILAAHPRPTGTICLLVHGLGGNEGVWVFRDPAHRGRGVSYGSLLAADLAYTPFYVRYNSGLPVAENGTSLTDLIERLVAAYPVPVREIVLIGHSMGGLVLRSACHQAVGQRRSWVEHVTRVFYLGTPHDGAGLERVTHLTSTTLHALRHPVTRIVADVLDIRSDGVKDLRHGNRQQAFPWLAHARHYLVAGTVTADPADVVSALLGDGLVGPPRAGWQRPTNGDSRVFPGVRHLGLARTPAVYRQIREWCEST